MTIHLPGSARHCAAARGHPSLTMQVIGATWDARLQDASDQAEAETNQPIASLALSWEEVFDTPYTVEHSS
jgi:hypothetical protein